MSEPSPQPAAQGNLAKTPLGHLVLYLYQHRSTGTLFLNTSPGSELDHAAAIRVLFQRGRAVAARFRSAVGTLEQGLMPYCAVQEAAFEFFQEDLVGTGPEIIVGMFDPLPFVMEAARRFPRRDAIEEVLARFAGSQLRVQMGSDLARLGLTPEETKVVDVLRAEPADIEALCLLSELPRESTRTLVYALVITRIAAPYEPRASPTFSTHIRVRDTASNVVQTRSSSPPRVLAPSMRPPGGTPAWQTIANRAASLRPPSSPGSGQVVKIAPNNTPRPSMGAPEALDAAGKWKRVEQLCQRSAFDEALPFIRALHDEDAKNPKYQGMLAYVLLARSPDNTVPREVIDLVNLALRANEEEVHALYTKALSYKRMGKDREALHYFKKTVSKEPGHIEAAREARLISMRQVDEKKTKR